MRRKEILVILILLILLNPLIINASNDKTLLLFIEDMSFEKLEVLEDLGLSLINIKTKNNTRESFYSSLNLGKSVSNLEGENINNSLGEILKDRGLLYFGEENSDIKYLFSNGKKALVHKKFNKNTILIDLKNGFKTADIIALELEDGELLKEIYDENIEKNIYIIPLSVENENFLNAKFTIFGKNTGKKLLTSKSTKRDGIITLEDITEDIKLNYDKEDKFAIGRKIEELNIKEPLLGVKKIHKSTWNIYYSAIFYQGLVMASIVFFALEKHLKKDLNMDKFILFSFSGIFTTLLAGILNLDSNLFSYLAFSLVVSTLFVKQIEYDWFLEIIFKIMYFTILTVIIIKPDYLYKSFLGFNNIVYGMRYYGINNGMAGAILALSIIVNWQIFKRDIEKFNFLTIIIPILNIVVMTTKFGANTGGFLTAIFLLIATIELYIFKDKKPILFIVLIISIILSVILLNMRYSDIAGIDSHLAKIILRIKINGYREIFDMIKVKLLILIKFTLSPPVLLTLIGIFYLFKKYFKRDEIVNLAIKTSIFGYIVNDTGYELSLYIMGFAIIYNLIYKKKNREEVLYEFENINS